jgi:hypothetical protein
MADRPISYKPEMIRAQFEDRKNNTRRVITRLLRFGPITEFGPSTTPGYDWHFRDRRMSWNDLTHAELLAVCPYGVVGDRLWARERRFMKRAESRITNLLTDVRVERVQDISEEDAKAEGVESLFTVEEAAERPEFDCDPMPYRNYLWHGNVGRGITQKQSDEWQHQFSDYKGARGSFSSLWHMLNAKRGYGWDANPWVWALTFNVIRTNIDQIGERDG